MKVLISGAGIAGPTLAYWLLRDGHEATIVECAPQLRTGGYVIDFWGRGYDIAGKMGLWPRLRDSGYFVEAVRFVDGTGKRVGGFPFSVLGEAWRNHYVSLRRGDLAAAIYETIAGRVETILGDSVVDLTADEDGIDVTFARGAPRRFDLVFGADGLHSRVREIAFGPQKRFEHYLGYKVAAFEMKGYRPREENVYVMYTDVGKQVARFAMRDDRTTILFVYVDGDDTLPDDLAGQRAALRGVYDEGTWECRPILAALGKSDDLYFDRVSQIQMDGWTRGRVALLGDAAFCASLLAGEGSALAMIAAYVLAGELRRSDDYRTAFANYERLMRPFIAEKQRAARGFAAAFAPKSRLGLLLRNQISKLMRIPLVTRATMARGLEDHIALPDYEDGSLPG